MRQIVLTDCTVNFSFFKIVLFFQHSGTFLRTDRDSFLQILSAFDKGLLGLILLGCFSKYNTISHSLTLLRAQRTKPKGMMDLSFSMVYEVHQSFFGR